jgi:hypothetical protein
LRASETLRTLIGGKPDATEGDVYIERISLEPMVGVGFVVGQSLSLILVLPPETLPSDVATARLVGRRNRMLNAHFGAADPTAIAVDYLMFDALTPAVAIVLDALTVAIESGESHLSAELLLDFLDLFRPSGTLSEDEILGLWGELITIASANDLDEAIRCWHDDPTDRYDFSKGSQRLEVKTTTKSVRSHEFSSSQLPAEDGIDLVVASILAEKVSGGEGILGLWQEINGGVIDPLCRKKLRDQVLNFVKKDEDKVNTMTFDRQLSEKSLEFFSSNVVPSLPLPHGVLRANWVSLLDEQNAWSDLQFIDSAGNLFLHAELEADNGSSNEPADGGLAHLDR